MGIMICAFKASPPDPIKQSSLMRPASVLRSRPPCFNGTNILSSLTAATKASVWIRVDILRGQKCLERCESADCAEEDVWVILTISF